MIKLEHVYKSFGKNKVISDFSCTVDDGEILCIKGGSGFGKTTLMRIMSGLNKPDSGTVLSTGGKYSFCFQENRLLPWLTVLDNLTAVGISRDTALKYLGMVGLGSDTGKLPRELSGGMKRRLSLCRCLAYDGDVFFLDEPLRELDAETRGAMLELIKCSLNGKTAVLITHSDTEAEYLASKIIELKK